MKVIYELFYEQLNAGKLTNVLDKLKIQNSFWEEFMWTQDR